MRVPPAGRRSCVAEGRRAETHSAPPAFQSWGRQRCRAAGPPRPRRRARQHRTSASASGDYSELMRVRVGTSGYSYKEWKGYFYPEDLPVAKMLEFYGQRFETVEINNTF